ncbi:Histone-lysine N-methyltransferase [Nymphaea thermarum]|nr:Histone-lysine N-methyltransferase [Nymphaea thermarum]
MTLASCSQPIIAQHCRPTPDASPLIATSSNVDASACAAAQRRRLSFRPPPPVLPPDAVAGASAPPPDASASAVITLASTSVSRRFCFIVAPALPPSLFHPTVCSLSQSAWFFVSLTVRSPPALSQLAAASPPVLTPPVRLKMLQEHGPTQVVLNALSKYIKATDSEIKSEKLPFSGELDDVGTPCSNQCYLLGEENVQVSLAGCEASLHGEKSMHLEGNDGTSVSSQSDGVTESAPVEDIGENMEVMKHGKKSLRKDDPSAEDSISKRQKTIAVLDGQVSQGKPKDTTSGYDDFVSAASDSKGYDDPIGASPTTFSSKKCAEKQSELTKGLSEVEQCSHGWNLIEKELYLKGLEIFGKNSCLIARNLLSGLKTCLEVSKYMVDEGSALHVTSAMLPISCLEDVEKVEADYTEQEVPSRTKFWRRRGRSRKLKYTWKSTGHPLIRKRIADGKQQSCKQYTPCGCQSMCGKQCPCLHNGTCCEKYCGCSKSCKNRFRGCHCAKSHCRSRQCPCFAAGRECDPDVCRNCWVSCGDGALGSPPTRGDNYQCGNMNLLLKQQQRILLAKSDVAGWGAFLKNPVNKNDYLGEYTGELISHREADKRGKIYDRANSSFLFDLNDQASEFSEGLVFDAWFVLDAYRKGDKLKFANHSSNPNCYAKVMMVAGDHRVGIFAKEHIDAGEELFYDYRYEPDRAPDWARKPEGFNSKKEDGPTSHGRAKKVA